MLVLRLYYTKTMKPKTRNRPKELKSAQKRLWELCKILTRKLHGNHCYTCGSYVEFPHTGHFITDSTCSTELSYDMRNLRPQCYPCNVHKSGNWVVFEARLIQENGQKYVDELKERNRKTKGLNYDLEWFLKKIEEYEKL